MWTMLLIDGDPRTRVSVQRVLHHDGWMITAAADANSGLSAVLGRHFDLIVVATEVISTGNHTIEQLRRRNAGTPIICVSSTDTSAEWARSLDRGADAFFTKPLNMHIFAAHARALARRANRPKDTSAENLRIGPVQLATQRREAHRDNQSVSFTPKEFDLLHLLARNPGITITRDELLQQIWRDSDASPNIVDVYIGYIRRKLTAIGAAGYLLTDRGKGYRIHNADADDG
jgi:DNA-binding response OmpR family regulator